MQAPTIGGVSIRSGNGQVIRLSRGASLADFADKIGANPASLVQIVFTQLGEMVTATQSAPEETLQLLGTELGFTPAIATGLIHETGDKAMPGAWLSFAAVLGLTGALALRRRQISAAADPA